MNYCPSCVETSLLNYMFGFDLFMTKINHCIKHKLRHRRIDFNDSSTLIACMRNFIIVCKKTGCIKST